MQNPSPAPNHTVTVRGGYSPAIVRVPAGAPVRIAFDRMEDSACSAELRIPAFDISESLPSFGTTLIEFTPREPGSYDFTCGMGMLRGTLVVEEASAVRAVTDADFDEVVGASTGPALVEFGAEWCGACRAMAPVVERLAADAGPSVLVAAVDTDASPRTAERFGIRSLPTFLFFRDGHLVDRMVGMTTRHHLEARLQERT